MHYMSTNDSGCPGEELEKSVLVLQRRTTNSDNNSQ